MRVCPRWLVDGVGVVRLWKEVRMLTWKGLVGGSEAGGRTQSTDYLIGPVSK